MALYEATAESWLASVGEFVSRPFSAIAEATSRRALSTSWTAASWVYRAVVLVLIASSLFYASSLLYAVLYYLVIPAHSHVKQVYFDFTPDQGPVTALVSLVHEQWWYSDASRVSAASRLLSSREPYDVFLDLTVPDIEENAQTGMLMLKASVHSGTPQSGRILAQSSRPLLLPYSSGPVRLCRQMLMITPLLLGLTQERQTLTVPLFEEYVESARLPSTFLNITLSNTGGTVRVYDAQLRFVVQLTGLRWVLYNWFFTSAFTGILTLSLCLGVLMILFYSIHHATRSKRKRETRPPAAVPVALQPPEPVQPTTFSSFESDEISHESDNYASPEEQKISESPENQRPKTE